MNNLSHTIRKFNRFELKYLVSMQQAEAFKQSLLAYLVPDNHGDGQGSYGVTSLYYDGPEYRFYWEKIDGIRFRRKLRIRHYLNGQPLADDQPVYVEIKQRLNRVTQKRRLVLSYQDALRLCNEHQWPQHTTGDNATAEEIMSMLWQYDLRPASVVTYNRLALVGTDYDIGLRVTFDRDLHCRNHPLTLQDSQSDTLMYPADWCIIEIKANERVPYWLTGEVARHQLSLMRVSKYCRSIELGSMIQAAQPQYHAL
ncbi:MAG TPA: polyphosphate polymerase domain-containing protein [Levilinea sp.]|nr:polyphosphate polymerase domain-containing protein [Levilinea sp.]